MRTLLWSLTIVFALQASDCATAGSIQDSKVTKAKREVDAEDRAKTLPAGTPGATPWPAPADYVQPKMPQRWEVKP